jgi:hypothetical protein
MIDDCKEAVTSAATTSHESTENSSQSTSTALPTSAEIAAALQSSLAFAATLPRPVPRSRNRRHITSVIMSQWMDRVKKAGKSVVDAGAKQILKVRRIYFATGKASNVSDVEFSFIVLTALFHWFQIDGHCLA